jgi:3-dehydroquinate dehydratase-2
MKILVLNGPNLNLLGSREVSHYGRLSLAQIQKNLEKLARELKVKLEFYQSNAEAELVGKIQAARGKFDGILINAAAYTHTSIAIRDALSSVGIPFVEIHLSNLAKREDFRHRSMLADLAVGVVFGFGPESYLIGLRGLSAHLKNRGK